MTKNNLIWIFLLILQWVGTVPCKPVTIERCFFHTHDVAQNGNVFESLIFYLSGDRKCELISSQKITNVQAQQIYRFSRTSCDQSAYSRFPLHSCWGYTISMARTGNDIDICVSYDAQKSKIIPISCRSIGNQWAIGFFCITKSPLPSKKTHLSKTRRVVIDCGHGGTDTGAVGGTGIQEKEITQVVGAALAKRLQLAGISVFLTRNSDVFISLDERTSLGNAYKPDLFISLHANHAKSRTTSGIETWILDTSITPFGVALNIEGTHVLQEHIFHKVSTSYRVANIIHQSLLRTMVEYNPSTIDRGIKKSVSQVLLGVEAPAILIELGFLSNPYEERLLTRSGYQQHLVDGIYKGVVNYFGQ